MTTSTSGVHHWVNYHQTASIRLRNAMTTLQQLSFIATFDITVQERLDAWVSYYKAIKPLYDAEDYEAVFHTTIPQ